MALIGYARVSALEDDPWQQQDALQEAGCERIFTDRASGALEERPELARALDHLRRGDTLVVLRMDRLGRSLRHLVDTVAELGERDVDFRSLLEGVDTSEPDGRRLFELCAKLAEFELDLIRERTQLAAARDAEDRGGGGGLSAIVDVAKRLPQRRAQVAPGIAGEPGASPPTAELDLPFDGADERREIAAARRRAVVAVQPRRADALRSAAVAARERRASRRQDAPPDAEPAPVEAAAAGQLTIGEQLAEAEDVADSAQLALDERDVVATPDAADEDDGVDGHDPAGRRDADPGRAARPRKAPASGEAALKRGAVSEHDADADADDAVAVRSPFDGRGRHAVDEPEAPGGRGAVGRRPARSARSEREAAERAPDAKRPPDAKRAPGRMLTLVAALVAAVAAGTAGLLAGQSGAGATEVALAKSAFNGDVMLRFPADWRRASPDSSIQALGLADPVVLEDGTPRGARIMAGTSPATGPTLLPSAILRRLDRAPDPRSTVRLGRLDAHRYSDLRLRGISGRTTIYVVPSSIGALTMACVAPAQGAAARPTCEAVARSLRLGRGRAFAPGPSRDYRSGLDAVLTNLDAARVRQRAELASARTRQAQGAAAQRLSLAFGEARVAAARMRVSPRENAAHERILAAVSSAGLAYGRMAQSTGQDGVARYFGARQAVREAETRLRAAIAALGRLGYRVAPRT